MAVWGKRWEISLWVFSGDILYALPILTLSCQYPHPRLKQALGEFRPRGFLRVNKVSRVTARPECDQIKVSTDQSIPILELFGIFMTVIL